MPVNLSPVGGAAAQFFTDAGDVLTGGKLYSYAAGTTTPAPTYTTNAGNIAHPNPIILNAAGRVPTGEIWLEEGISYKFVLTDANDVLIATYDNITGINSSAKSQGYVTASQAQTLVSVPFSYTLGINSLNVYVNGSKQVVTLNYTETTVTSVTFLTGLNIGDIVEFTS
jgi:hypothetical protein